MRPGRLAALLASMLLPLGAAVPADARTDPSDATEVISAPAGAPTGLTAAPIDSGAVLRWTAPSDPTTTPITGYLIRVKPGTATAMATNVTAFTVGGLVNGERYRFTVEAVTGAGSGP